MRHQQSHWNGICLDIYIETTFMRGRKNPEGNAVFKARRIMSYLQSQNTGETRALKSKSGLKKLLQVEMSLRLQPKPNVVITDSCAQLWITSWLTNGSVKDLGDALHHLVLSYLIINTDTQSVFDRYYGYPIKGLTRAQRSL